MRGISPMNEKFPASKLINKYAESYILKEEENSQLKKRIKDLEITLKYNKDIIVSLTSNLGLEEKVNNVLLKYTEEIEFQNNRIEKLTNEVNQWRDKLIYSEKVAIDNISKERNEVRKLQDTIFFLENCREKQNNEHTLLAKKCSKLEQTLESGIYCPAQRELIIIEPMQAVNHINDELLLYKEVYKNLSESFKSLQGNIKNYEKTIEELQYETGNLIKEVREKDKLLAMQLAKEGKEQDLNRLNQLTKDREPAKDSKSKKDIAIQEKSNDCSNNDKSKQNKTIASKSSISNDKNERKPATVEEGEAQQKEKEQLQNNIKTLNYCITNDVYNYKLDTSEWREVIRIVGFNEDEYNSLFDTSKNKKAIDSIDVLISIIMEKNIQIDILNLENTKLNSENQVIYDETVILKKTNKGLEEKLEAMKAVEEKYEKLLKLQSSETNNNVNTTEKPNAEDKLSENNNNNNLYYCAKCSENIPKEKLSNLKQSKLSQHLVFNPSESEYINTQENQVIFCQTNNNTNNTNNININTRESNSAVRVKKPMKRKNTSKFKNSLGGSISNSDSILSEDLKDSNKNDYGESEELYSRHSNSSGSSCHNTYLKLVNKHLGSIQTPNQGSDGAEFSGRKKKHKITTDKLLNPNTKKESFNSNKKSSMKIISSNNQCKEKVFVSKKESRSKLTREAQLNAVVTANEPKNISTNNTDTAANNTNSNTNIYNITVSTLNNNIGTINAESRILGGFAKNKRYNNTESNNIYNKVINNLELNLVKSIVEPQSLVNHKNKVVSSSQPNNQQHLDNISSKTEVSYNNKNQNKSKYLNINKKFSNLDPIKNKVLESALTRQVGETVKMKEKNNDNNIEEDREKVKTGEDYFNSPDNTNDLRNKETKVEINNNKQQQQQQQQQEANDDNIPNTNAIINNATNNATRLRVILKSKNLQLQLNTNSDKEETRSPSLYSKKVLIINDTEIGKDTATGTGGIENRQIEIDKKATISNKSNSTSSKNKHFYSNNSKRTLNSNNNHNNNSNTGNMKHRLIQKLNLTNLKASNLREREISSNNTTTTNNHQFPSNNDLEHLQTEYNLKDNELDHQVEIPTGLEQGSSTVLGKVELKTISNTRNSQDKTSFKNSQYISIKTGESGGSNDHFYEGNVKIIKTIKRQSNTNISEDIMKSASGAPESKDNKGKTNSDNNNDDKISIQENKTGDNNFIYKKSSNSKFGNNKTDNAVNNNNSKATNNQLNIFTGKFHDNLEKTNFKPGDYILKTEAKQGNTRNYSLNNCSTNQSNNSNSNNKIDKTEKKDNYFKASINNITNKILNNIISKTNQANNNINNIGDQPRVLMNKLNENTQSDLKAVNSNIRQPQFNKGKSDDEVIDVMKTSGVFGGKPENKTILQDPEKLENKKQTVKPEISKEAKETKEISSGVGYSKYSPPTKKQLSSKFTNMEEILNDSNDNESIVLTKKDMKEFTFDSCTSTEFKKDLENNVMNTNSNLVIGNNNDLDFIRNKNSENNNNTKEDELDKIELLSIRIQTANY